MTIIRIRFRYVLLPLLCLVLCISLSGCRKQDDIIIDFYNDTKNGEYNAIKLDLGEENSAIYYIDEHYGIWSNGDSKYLFDFYYVLRRHGGRGLMIQIATEQSYYQSMIQQGDALASFYYGDLVFNGQCEFSDDELVAKISPDYIYFNKMHIESDKTVIMTKINISADDIIPFDVALNDMAYVPDAYFEFVSNKTDSKYLCKMANLRIDGTTMTGEWVTNGTIIPIRMQMHDKVPYLEIFDTSGPADKLILKAYAKVLNETSIELVDPTGDIFYTAPLIPVIVTKTN